MNTFGIDMYVQILTMATVHNDVKSCQNNCFVLGTFLLSCSDTVSLLQVRGQFHFWKQCVTEAIRH